MLPAEEQMTTLRRANPRGPSTRARADVPGTTAAKAKIAELSMVEIRSMADEELVAVICAADVPLFRENTIGRLRFFDRETLEHLTFLARRTMRNQGY